MMNLPEIPDAAAVAIATGLKWLIYTFLVWVMIKIQKMQYNALGMFASTAAAMAATFIPYAGPYVAHAVLVFCLWKCTRATIAPDVLFTVTIAGALMFCVNLWVIGALMGELRPMPVMAQSVSEDAEESTAEEEALPAETRAPVTRITSAPNGLVLKGICVSSSKRLAMISAGDRVHTVAAGEGFLFRSEEGAAQVRCDEINRTSVLLTINDTRKVEMTLR